MSKTFLKYFMYFVIFSALGAGGSYLFFKMIDLSKTVEVPALTGRSITEATELLNQRKLALNIKSRNYDNNVPEGYISQQLQEPGKRIKSGSEVDVVVSSGKGGELFSMPSFEGQFLDEAKLTLNNLDIKTGKVTLIHSDAAEKGTIIAQRPLPGNTGSNEINFLVSTGPYDVFYKCPSFVNMNLDDVRTLAEKLGIKLVEQDEGSRILSQNPEAGAIIKKGDSVEITLGRSRMWF
ncbi:MAG: PASTA domain-containing protein [Nitrospirae bacterium]|nr:PASTA domain-containing protein [Nitrospirota bacterium]